MKQAKRLLCAALVGAGVSGTALAQYSTPMRDVENPARTPVTVSESVTLQASIGGSFGNPIYTVPAGKRLVIEFAAVACTSSNGDRANQILIGVAQTTGALTTTRTFALTITDHGTDAFGTRHSAASQVVRLYADSATFTSVTLGVSRSGAAGTMNCAVDISGHLITL